MTNRKMSLPEKVGYLRHVLLRNNRISYKVIRGKNDTSNIKILGMIRLRNESLVLRDTLDALSKHVDAVVIFDDASTDDSVEIAVSHPLVKEVIVNKHWRKGRVWEETANRRLLFQRSKRYHPNWFFYSDADERFEGDIYTYLTEKVSDDVDGIRIRLFDAYITPDDKDPYERGMRLFGFRKLFGIERRDILMIWKNKKGVDYLLPDSREPTGITGVIESKFYCQHYGKALSIEQWEENCLYYYNNFPAYSQKWKSRMGKAVHTKSDFETSLEPWDKAKRSKTFI